MRAATNGGYALGNAAFATQIAAALGQRVTRGEAGRPAKPVNDERQRRLARLSSIWPDRQPRIPFGPGLILATVIVFLGAVYPPTAVASFGW